MQKHFAIALAMAASATAMADTNDIKANTPYSAYLQDSRGVIVRNSTGLCWHVNYWTPADAVIGCDGDLVVPVANPIAPPLVAQNTQPVPVLPPPPAPAPKPCDFTFVLKADETFTFDNAKLSEAAKRGLDADFRKQLGSCATVQNITVTGYTDRLGTDSYNLKLSEKRAEVVATYLKSTGTSAPLEVRGLGKAQELAACTGVKGQKKLIACLAPNRRVTIEVHGLGH